MNFEAALALIVLSLSIWSALALLLDRRGHVAINRRFSLVILLFCIPQAYFYARLVGHDNQLLGVAAQAAIWLKGPLLLSTVRLIIGQPMRSGWRHFAPFPLALVGMLLSPQWMLEWGLAGFAALLGYLVLSMRDLQRSRSRLALIYSAYRNSAYYWLLYVVAGLLVLVSVDLVLMAHAYVQRYFLTSFIQVTNWLVASYFIVIAFCSVYRPEIFFHEGRVEDAVTTSVHAEPEPASQSAPSDSPATTWRELDESVARALSQRLEQLMNQGLYRQHDLSLGALATRLGASVHQTSELLNVHLRLPFYEYLNQHRLRHACMLLEDPRCQMRVIDVAFEAGFGNKNSFYRSFREAHGTTPVEYRKRCMEARAERAADPRRSPARESAAVQSQKPS